MAIIRVINLLNQGFNLILRKPSMTTCPGDIDTLDGISFALDHLQAALHICCIRRPPNILICTLNADPCTTEHMKAYPAQAEEDAGAQPSMLQMHHVYKILPREGQTGKAPPRVPVMVEFWPLARSATPKRILAAVLPTAGASSL